MKRLILLILSISLMAFMGCQKEPLTKVDNNTSTAEVVMRTLKSGGDDEDPFIRGNIVNGNGGSVSGALVELFVDGGSTPVATGYTNSNGLFQFQATQGDYYIAVTPGVQSPVNTDVFTLTSNTHMTIEI